MTNVLRQLMPALVLSAWGVVMLQAWASDRLNGLLAARFHGLAALCGLLLLILALAWIVAVRWGPPVAKTKRRKAAEPPPRPVLAGVLLTAFWQTGPLLAVATLTPTRFSETFLANRQEMAGQMEADMAARYRGTGARLVQLASLPKSEAPLALAVAEVVAAADIPEARHVLENRLASVRGIFFPGKDGKPQLLQVLIFCCAADALPVTVGLKSDVPLAYFPDELVEVVGRLHFAEAPARSGRRAWIEVESTRALPSKVGN